MDVCILDLSEDGADTNNPTLILQASCPSLIYVNEAMTDRQCMAFVLKTFPS